MDAISQRLLDSLHELQLIDADKLNSVALESDQTGERFSELLLKYDLISDENLGKSLADVYGLPFLTLANRPLDPVSSKVFPEHYVKRHSFLFIGVEQNSAKVAVTNPDEFKNISRHVAQKLGLPLKIYLVTERDLEQAITIFKKNLQERYNQLLSSKVTQLGKPTSDLPIEDIVSTLIEYAYSNRASDIHLEPEKEKSIVRFRVDGILQRVLEFTPQVHEQVVSRIKFLANLRTDEHLSGQDGKIRTSVENEDVDIRVSIVPIVHGEKVVMRLLTARFRQFGLVDLGMDEEDMKKVKHAMGKQFGMILSTGPTGSGKSTTMYGLLKMLNTTERNIATIEDPVEYEIEGINQIQVNALTDITFANGLRSILRQDPNIIYVGEIRDNETADIAINAAMTGHVVLSTLHTNDAATALPRLMDMDIEAFLVASTVNIIIAQRLVRTICDACKYSEVIRREDFEKEPLYTDLPIKHFFSSETLDSVRMYKGKGCPVCHQTGYQGRVGIFEILVMTDEIRQLIANKKDASVILQEARREGMETMLEDGIDKVKRGVTTIEELLRVTQE